MGRGGEDFHSPLLQLGAIRQRIAGMLEVAVIEDIDRTGRDFAREGIDKLRELAEDKAFDVLAVLDVSRLGRNVKESLTFLDWLADRGITIISASEQIDTSTPAGRLMLTNMLSIAQYRSDEIGAHWTRLIDKRAQSGLHHVPPAGYHRVDRQMVPHPTLGPVWAEVFKMYARDERVRDICRYIHAMTGRPTRAPNLKRNLRNPVYAGFATLHGEILPGAHDALVDQETWRLVQDRLAREEGEPPRLKGNEWSMSGLIVCARDGADLHPVQSQGRIVLVDGTEGRRLICARQQQLPGSCIGVGSPSSTTILPIVLDRVATYIELLRTDPTAQAEALARQASAGVDVATLTAQLAKVRGAMAKLATSYAMSELPEHAYRQSMAELTAAESAAATALRTAEKAGTVRMPVEAANAAQALLDLWPNLTEAERNRALKAIVERIVLRPKTMPKQSFADRIDVEWL